MDGVLDGLTVVELGDGLSVAGSIPMTTRFALGQRLGLTRAQTDLLLRLRTPERIQDFITSLSINHELNGDSCLSVIGVLEHRHAHCIEGAFVAACALNPQRDEAGIARALRRASPTATPNIRIVLLADRLLGRDGRMVAAIEMIGRGEFASEAVPFRLELE